MSLNLHGIVRGAIGAVNPDITATIQASTGYTTDDTGRQVPSYSGPIPIRVQVQPLSSGDLQQIDASNMQGVMKAAYLFGSAEGIVRPLGQGGDLLTFAGQVWLVTQSLENWGAEWSKVAITLQTDVAR